MAAYIPQPSRTEKRIRNRMQQQISIGMPQQSGFVRNRHATYD
jgi:hypothetical protein